MSYFVTLDLAVDCNLSKPANGFSIWGPSGSAEYCMGINFFIIEKYILHRVVQDMQPEKNSNSLTKYFFVMKCEHIPKFNCTYIVGIYFMQHFQYHIPSQFSQILLM